MGTKLEELRNGCFHAAMDDEPMFVGLARDPSMPTFVRVWADTREAEIKAGTRPASDMSKVAEARATADKMEQWRKDNDGAWRTDNLFVGLTPEQIDVQQKQIDNMLKPCKITDPRPANCRERLREQGKPYPRSGCSACRKSLGMLGCPHMPE